MDEDTQQTALDAFAATEVSLRADTVSDMDWPEGTQSGDEVVRRSTAAEIDAAFVAILDEDVIELRDSAIVDTLDVPDPDPDPDARIAFLDTATLDVPARGSRLRMETCTDVAAASPPPRIPLPRRLPTEAGWSPPPYAPRPARVAAPVASRERRAAVFAAVPDEEAVIQVDDDLV